MLVKIFGHKRVYDSEKQPILLMLTDREKEVIGAMDGKHFVCCLPQDTKRNKLFELKLWMRQFIRTTKYFREADGV